MRLIIVHYHLRPGGVRRIIELATPHLVREFKGPIDAVTLATGEPPDATWRDLFQRQMAPIPVDYFVDPSLHYFSEQRLSPVALRRRLREALRKLFEAGRDNETVVWAHNLGIGRNLILATELVQACERRRIRLAAHHHDWWFDNRWVRWPEIQQEGARTLGEAARALFPRARQVRHITINQADARVLKPHLPRNVTWIPNLAERASLPSPKRIQAARRWMRSQLATGSAPIWILPCRLLRRKNVAEALLLMRWLRPEAWLVTTGGTSSEEEVSYAHRLRTAAQHHRWPLRLSLLAGGESGKPTVPELIAASECLLLTSAQEGFGLPYLEAAAASRPLIARTLPNIAPDLAEFGFEFPQAYDEIRIASALFDADAELRRQTALFQCWRQSLPRTCRALAEVPALRAQIKAGAPVAFSRLTLTAQLEVLAQPVDESWKSCRPLNPFLESWRQRAAAGRLRTSSWPTRSAQRWLSGPAFAQRWSKAVLQSGGQPPDAAAAASAQHDFIAEKLKAKFLYPLLWGTES